MRLGLEQVTQLLLSLNAQQSFVAELPFSTARLAHSAHIPEPPK